MNMIFQNSFSLLPIAPHPHPLFLYICAMNTFLSLVMRAAGISLFPMCWKVERSCPSKTFPQSLFPVTHN